jgi:predicted nucleotide-binding protein (sugar kinase/HSP70/actin superfamily)
MWAAFFDRLGVRTLVSEPTARVDLEKAQGLTRSDLCLPVKVFLGHVERLKDRVDWLLLPRMVSLRSDAFMCPKVLGLTDVARSVFRHLPRLLDPKVNLKAGPGHGLAEACTWVGRHFTRDSKRLDEAWAAAQAAQAHFERRALDAPLDQAISPWDGGGAERPETACLERPAYRVAVIGRPYITFDRALSHNLLSHLQSHGVEVVTPERVPSDERERQSTRICKRVYWQLGRDLVSGAMHYMDCPGIDGIINLSSFGCGQDSFTSALVEHYVTRYSDKPILNLVLDEHTADAGLKTRLEAFLDMMDRRRRRPGPHPFPQSEGAQLSSLPENRPVAAREMHLTIPHMGYLHLGFEKVLSNLGAKITLPPRPNKEALVLGTRYAPEGACLPFKLNLGNMIQALNRGATDIIMPGGFGPCRFGYYSVIQEQILRDLGYDFRMGRADDPDSLRDMLETIKRITGLNSKWASYKVFFFILHRIALADWALERAHWLRPREIERRSADRALSRSLKVIEETRRFRDLWRAKREVRRILASVPVNTNRPVLRVGLVGEIFMVLENFANMNVEERLGEMGVEIHRAVWLSDWLNDRFRFKLLRRNQFQWSLRKAQNYLRDPSGGESISTVGKSVFFAENRFDGIVHLMPFTCMPELVAQTILHRVSKDFEIPVLTLIFDEHTSPGAVQTRLEAFVDLIRRRRP